MKMTQRVRAALWVALPVALLAACSTPDKPKPPPVQAVVQAPGKSVVAVGEGNDGASVVLEKGQELRVNLPLDADMVNTNTDWRIAQNDPAVLESVSSVFERGGRDNNPSEAGGTTVWRFKPKAPGHVGLAFELRQARSRGAPAQTLRYDVTVK